MRRCGLPVHAAFLDEQPVDSNTFDFSFSGDVLAWGGVEDAGESIVLTGLSRSNASDDDSLMCEAVRSALAAALALPLATVDVTASQPLGSGRRSRLRGQSAPWRSTRSLA